MGETPLKVYKRTTQVIIQSDQKNILKLLNIFPKNTSNFQGGIKFSRRDKIL